MRKVDVIIPVYKGLEETRRCLTSVLATVQHQWARVIVINDASPEPAITAYLRELAAEQEQLVLLENEQNLGFVATVNRGMQYDTQRDVLLLNSDVEVANDWLHRMRVAAYQNEKVASLTPFCNNATIFSFPRFCADNSLPFGLSLGEIDACFAARFGPQDVIPVPTGVGCCMYLRRDCLDDVGYFDRETFGRGYGEENDWCQRAEKAGWRNLHLANCFVYHAGGVSFGEEQQALVDKAQVLLAQKHPRYAADIEQYLAADPAREKRGRALLALLAARNLPTVIMISHNLGGGAQQHVEELVQLYQGRAQFLQLTPENEGESVLLSCYDGKNRLPDGLHFEIPGEYDKLLRLLSELGVGRVHFHHTMGLPPRLWLLAKDLGVGHDLTIHDYYLVNGNPTLTDRDARFVSESLPDFDEQCAGHYPLPPGIDADQWRDNQRLLVENADRVIFPSADASRRFCRFFDISSPVTAWHPDYQISQPYPEPRWRQVGDRPLRVLVLGALSREKGADSLEALAASMAGEAIEFHLLGYAYRALGGGVVTHGPYENAEVYALIEAIDPDVVWYPALWPETYSYTLSLALHCGLPVVVPDIGAFPERVSQRALSAVMPWNLSLPDWRLFWQEVLASEGLPAHYLCTETLGTHVAPDTNFYRDGYLQAVVVTQGELKQETLDSLANNYHLVQSGLSRSERLLRSIWRFSRSPIVAKCVALVPFRLKQSFKRRLSSRPMHDIVYKE
jgi:GT2 family glycosyltransferase/glycosyltransferase involved in cell wall biosynthesis